MDPAVTESLMLFVTDRDAFNTKYAGTVIPAFCNELMMESESRPHSAERIAILKMGHSIFREKKYDGWFYCGGKRRFSEYKVTCRYAKEDGTYTTMASIGINDVSRNVVDRYIADQPLFVFPYFIDGHLVAMFSVDFKYLQPKYEQFVAARLAGKKVDGRARLTLSLQDWLAFSNVEYVHRNMDLVNKLGPTLRRKIQTSFSTAPTLGGITVALQNIVRFPAGHKFAEYGYDFGTETPYSFVCKPEGTEIRAKYSFKNYATGKHFNISDLRDSAAAQAGITVGPRPSPGKTQVVTKRPAIKVLNAMAQPNISGDFGKVRVTVELSDSITLGELRTKLSGTGARILIEA